MYVCMNIYTYIHTYIHIISPAAVRSAPAVPPAVDLFSSRGRVRVRASKGPRRALDFRALAMSCAQFWLCFLVAQNTSTDLHTSQHTSAYLSIRPHTSAYINIRQDTSGYVSIRQHTSDLPCCTASRQSSSTPSGSDRARSPSRCAPPPPHTSPPFSSCLPCSQSSQHHECLCVYIMYLYVHVYNVWIYI
jgi:hypothetical protein